MKRDHDDDLIRTRLENLERIAAPGAARWPSRFDADLSVAEAVARFAEQDTAALEAAAPRHRLAGRMIAIRRQGKTVFLDLGEAGRRIQVLARKNDLTDAEWATLESLDLGDHLGVEGRVGRTKVGELTVFASHLTYLGKALRPMPEKWHGLKDVEQRYRHRYLDLMANPEIHRIFETRSALVRGIRAFYDQLGFLEVETPMMHSVAGGALARPFVTHHNALDIDLFLRIAPELFLKRLVVGGMPRVYEINRNFRNEGVSTRHNPEFTMLELYMAWADDRVLMDMTERLFVELAQRVRGDLRLPWGDEVIDLSPPWRRVGMDEAVLEAGARLDPPILPGDLADAERLLAVARRVGCERPERFTGNAGKLLAELFEALVEPSLLQPTFVTRFPVAVSPLSKRNPEDPSIVDRFELFIGRMEVANGFSELNDPIDQEERFQGQVEAKAGGEEHHPMDEDYIRALEHGLPPTAGEGIGIDRLTMLFTNQSSIREVILFPLLRPKAE